jgi:hypothetical protein
MTLAESFEQALQLANRYSVAGRVLATSKIQDYQNKRSTLANHAQQELARIARIPAMFSVVRDVRQPTLSSFDTTHHINDDVILGETLGAKAYCIEVGGEASIYIEEETSTDVWTLRDTITAPGTTPGYTQYKGVLAGITATNEVRIRLSGSYPYPVKNYALWNITFKDDASVPDYRPFISVSLPSDFLDINETVHRNEELILPSGHLRLDIANRTILIPYDFVGTFEIHYFKKPTVIDSTTLTTYEFELVDGLALTAIPYYIAGVMISEEMGEVSNFCMQRYDEIRGMLMSHSGNKSANVTQVNNVMFGRRSQWRE